MLAILFLIDLFCIIIDLCHIFADVTIFISFLCLINLRKCSLNAKFLKSRHLCILLWQRTTTLQAGFIQMNQLHEDDSFLRLLHRGKIPQWRKFEEEIIPFLCPTKYQYEYYKPLLTDSLLSKYPSFVITETLDYVTGDLDQTEEHKFSESSVGCQLKHIMGRKLDNGKGFICENFIAKDDTDPFLYSLVFGILNIDILYVTMLCLCTKHMMINQEIRDIHYGRNVKYPSNYAN